MNGFVMLRPGLEVLVVNDMSRLSGPDASRARDIIRAGEHLQLEVFREHRVPSPSARVLPAEESVGGPETSPQLDGSSPTYHMLFVVDHGKGSNKPVAMTATEEVKLRNYASVMIHKKTGMVLSDKARGWVVLEYFPALVLPGFEGATYSKIEVSALQNSKDFATHTPSGDSGDHMSLYSILTQFTRHLTRGSDEFAGRVTDGIGVKKTALRSEGYRRSEAGISVPSQSALTWPEYNDSTLKHPVHLWMKFATPAPYASGWMNALPKNSAMDLFVAKYLKGGYIDPDTIASEDANRLDCVIKTRKAIRNVAEANLGYIPFR